MAIGYLPQPRGHLLSDGDLAMLRAILRRSPDESSVCVSTEWLFRENGHTRAGETVKNTTQLALRGSASEADFPEVNPLEQDTN